MELSPRRWKPGQLLASWGVYWAGLIGVGLGPAIAAGLRATRVPAGGGSIEAKFDNGTLNFVVMEEGVKTFAASLPFSTAMLWVVVPPLLLWLAWLIVRRTPDNPQRTERDVRPEALGVGTQPAEERVVDQGERIRADRKRTPTPNP
jgi:hypothetical protein